MWSQLEVGSLQAGIDLENRTQVLSSMTGDMREAEVQKAFAKQLGYLLRDIRHPSLHAKKYDEVRDIWQARATGSWRFYFRIEGDAYVLETINRHPK